MFGIRQILTSGIFKTLRFFVIQVFIVADIQVKIETSDNSWIKNLGYLNSKLLKTRGVKHAFMILLTSDLYLFTDSII